MAKVGKNTVYFAFADEIGEQTSHKDFGRSMREDAFKAEFNIHPSEQLEPRGVALTVPQERQVVYLSAEEYDKLKKLPDPVSVIQYFDGLVEVDEEKEAMKAEIEKLKAQIAKKNGKKADIDTDTQI